MTAPRYVGRFMVILDEKVVLMDHPQGGEVFCKVTGGNDKERRRRAKWIAAALNAYNQQEQETKT